MSRTFPSPRHALSSSLLVRLSVIALAVLTVSATLVLAAVPTFWRLESQADFLRGATDGISIASDGTISLAPAAQMLYEATDPHFWSVAVDASGNVFLGSGNDGKIYKMDASGGTSVLADTNELQVHALAVDRRGNVYAGTSPRGVVHRIASDGTQSTFFDPDDRYIWDLAVDSQGRVLVATGDKAQVYRVSPSGQSETLFTSEETHIVCLAVDADDRIYAGTDSNGLVLRIETGPSSATSVLFDTPFQEVRALVLDTRGNVYAATVNGGDADSRSGTPEATPDSTSPTAGGPPLSQTLGEAVTVIAATDLGSTVSTSTSSSSASQNGAVYRIDADGAAEILWQSSEDTPLSLSLARDDRVMIGTGDDGRVFLVSQDKTSTLLLSVEADQITAIRPGPDGQSLLATSNPAKLYRLNRGRRTEGIYRSPTKDTETVSSWGQIRWDARVPQGTVVRLQTRTGNSAEPDNTWSEWSADYASFSGEQITSPSGRFLQWRAVLNSTGDVGPELFDVTAVYLQQNLAPEVTKIEIHDPGQVFMKPMAAGGQIEIFGMDDSVPDGQLVTNAGGRSGSSSQAAAAAAMANLAALSRPLYRKGLQTVTWSASDPNQDDLTFDVLYRAEDETLWRTLRAGLKSPVIAWDTVAMPDGRYTLRVVASDARSNPAELARTGERVTHSFEVDNTPPRVTELQVQPAASSGGHRVTFVAEDDVSPVRQVEYAINSGDWKVVFPIDGIADSPRESFDFRLEGFSDGVYTLVVKVTDALGNASTARAELR